MSSVWHVGSCAIPLEDDTGAVRHQLMLLWTEGERVRYLHAAEPDETPEQALRASWVGACKEPAQPLEPGFPRRVVTADASLAEALEEVLGVDVEVGPTPGVDEAFDRFLERLEEESPMLERDPLEGVPETERAALLELAGDLWHAAPWQVLPPDTPLQIRLDDGTLDDGQLVVIGQEGVNFGFLLFESEGAWRAFADVARQTVPLPPVEPLKVLSLELLPMRAEDGSAFILPDPGGLGAGGWRALDERELRLAIYAAQGLDRFLQERARDILEAVEAGEGRRIEGRYAIRPPGFEKRSIRLSLSL